MEIREATEEEIMMLAQMFCDELERDSRRLGRNISEAEEED